MFTDCPRLLHHLAYPYNISSYNYNIDRSYTTVKYQSLHDAVQLIHHQYPIAYLAKSDIADAFRLPVSPSHYHLLGFQFDGMYYYEKMLSMGAAPSCHILKAFSSALQLIFQTKYRLTSTVKVIDDLLFVQPTHEQCLRDLNTFQSLCHYLNVSIAT